MPKKSILVIDDEKNITDLLRYNLEKEGYEVHACRTGEQGFETARQKRPDLVILDLMLPQMDGIEVLKLLRSARETRQIPVLMLTAKSTELDQVLGLELGAVDYITKPFSVKVLLVRVKNVFRGNERKGEEPVVIRSGEIMLDREKLSLTVKGKPVSLTRLEFNILAFLMRHPGRVFSREELLSGAWKDEAFVVDRTVDAHIKSIRHKLGRHREAVETVRGAGYRFAEAGA